MLTLIQPRHVEAREGVDALQHMHGSQQSLRVCQA